MTGWRIEDLRGTAAELHGRELPDEVVPTIWWMDVVRPAVVLGSAQPDAVVDAEAARRRGLDVVRRRSGGGAVLLVPGAVTWVDVLVPVGHERWEHDVGRAFWWLGRAWAGALGALGVGDVAVHEAGLVHGPWSDLVCFAGLGAGEVTAGGRKVVGLSQRRTRAGARFQCLLLHRWDPSPLVEVLQLHGDDRRQAAAALEQVATGIGPRPASVVRRALLEQLAPQP